MEELTINLEQVVPGGVGGEYRSRDHQGHRRPVLLIENAERPVVVKATLLSAMRGTLDASGSPASLLLFQFSFQGPQARRVSKSTITITFEDRDGPTAADPVVDNISADGTFALNPKEESSDVTHEFSTSLNGSYAAAGGEIGYHYTLGKKVVTQHSATIKGEKRRFKSYGEETSAVWELEEDPKSNPEEGIPTLLRVAVVLCHEETDEFRFFVEIDSTHKGLFFFYGSNKSAMIKPREVDSKALRAGEQTKNLGSRDLDGEEFLLIRTTRPITTA